MSSSPDIIKDASDALQICGLNVPVGHDGV